MDIGWIHKRNNKILKFLKKENDFIDLKEVKKISRNKNFYAKLNKKQNEFCPVFAQPSFSPKVKFNHNKVFGIDKLFDIERNLLAPLGLPQYGIHANGWSKKKSEYFFHFAIRSEQIKHFPNLYDNIFAGGQPSEISIQKNLKKEAFEESGIKIKKKI